METIFNMNEFLTNLQQYKGKKPNPPNGFDHVVKYMCNLTPSKHIDFDSFSKEECDKAMIELWDLPVYDESFEDTGEDFMLDIDNAYTKKYFYPELISHFSSNAKKRYVPATDDVFL